MLPNEYWDAKSVKNMKLTFVFIPYANLPVPHAAPPARPAAQCGQTPPPQGRGPLREGSTERVFPSEFLSLEPELLRKLLCL